HEARGAPRLLDRVLRDEHERIDHDEREPGGVARLQPAKHRAGAMIEQDEGLIVGEPRQPHRKRDQPVFGDFERAEAAGSDNSGSASSRSRLGAWEALAFSSAICWYSSSRYTGSPSGAVIPSRTCRPLISRTTISIPFPIRIF